MGFYDPPPSKFCKPLLIFRGKFPLWGSSDDSSYFAILIPPLCFGDLRPQGLCCHLIPPEPKDEIGYVALLTPPCFGDPKMVEETVRILWLQSPLSRALDSMDDAAILTTLPAIQHLEEGLLDQAQAQPPYTVLF